MAKKKTRQQPQPARRATSGRRGESERRTRLLVVGGVVLVVLVVAGLIGFGWYQTQVKPLAKTVLKVGDTKVSLEHLERRVSLYLDENSYLVQPGFEDFIRVLPDTVLEEMEREAKLLEAADEIGVTVTDEEVAQRIREEGDLSAEVAPNVYAQALRQQVEDSGLKLGEYQQMIRAELLEEKALEHFTEAAAKSEPQVRGRWLVFETMQEAEEAVQRLAAGEDLDAIAEDPPKGAEGDAADATAESDEEGDAAQTTEPLEVTEVEWSPQGLFPDQALEDFLFEAEQGEFSEPIAAGLGYYVVELVERDEDRELDEDQKTQVANRDLEGWLDSLDDTLVVVIDLTPDDRARALGFRVG